MKFSQVFSILILVTVSSPLWGRTLLQLPRGQLSAFADLNSGWASGAQESQVESLLLSLASFDEAWNRSLPHLAEEYLEWGVNRCDAFSLEELIRSKDILSQRAIGCCWILESEWSNRISPWKAYKIREKLQVLNQGFEQSALPKSEQLYIEGRVYSSLPPLLGQNFKKALVALEMLRRFEPDESLSVPWIHRTRQLQGKTPPQKNVEPTETYFQHKETDGLPISLFPLLTGNFPQGFGVQLRGIDSAIFDKKRRIGGRVFVTHRGSVGGEIKFQDDETLSQSSLLARLEYLHGIQLYYGLGINSPSENVDLYVDRGVFDLAIRHSLWEAIYFQLGYRFHSAHLRKVEGGTLESGLPQISNAVDSGVVGEVGFDSRDSQNEPFLGNRIYLQAYVPRKGFGSPRGFERLILSAEDYHSLGLTLKLKTSASLVSVSEGAPFYWFSQLSGTVPFSGLRPSRYLDRSLAAAATELRWKAWGPFTLFGYANLGSVGPTIGKIFENPFKVGAGIGAEIHLTRFRYRAFRAEAGFFGGQFTFNSMLGLPLE